MTRRVVVHGLLQTLTVALAAIAKDMARHPPVVEKPEIIEEEVPKIDEIRDWVPPRQAPMKLYTKKQVPKNQKRFKPRGRR